MSADQRAAQAQRAITLARRVLLASRTADGIRELPCEQCGKTYTARRSDSRFCGATCRQRHHRERS